MMLHEDVSKPKPRLGKLFKSILYWSHVEQQQKQQQIRDVYIPVHNLYGKQIQQCQEMYNRLQLDRHEDQWYPNTAFPLIRSKTMITQSRPVTYKVRKKLDSLSRPISMRSAPAFMHKNDTDEIAEVENEVDTVKVDTLSQSTDCDYDIHGQTRKRSKMDSEQLCDYLNERGLGFPALVRTPYTSKRISQSLPRGVKNRALPKNPSSREKIKGRARLDQEMANMKALAFCEQQAPKVLRTASANMKNRDVQLMEEELRENMHKEEFENGDFEDDNASVVMMPVKQEELFLRINTWIDEVENARKSHVHTQGEESNNHIS